MSLTILKAILVCGIIGHAINMYCDRLLSIFPNGVIKFSNFDDLKDSKKMAKLMDGVSEKIPMRSAILGAFAIFLEVLGYYALTAYMYEHSKVCGIIMFLCTTLFATIGTAHHVKCGLAEYAFIKLGRDEKAHAFMLDLNNSAPITKTCFVFYLAYIVTLIVAILTGVATFPLWAVIFTILPIVTVMWPLGIIGTMHIAAMISFAAWIFLL